MTKPNKTKHIYRRHLPHIQLDQAIYFVTFRLHGSLPKNIIEQLKEERMRIENQLRNSSKPGIEEKLIRLKKEQFIRVEKYLDSCHSGPDWLK